MKFNFRPPEYIPRSRFEIALEIISVAGLVLQVAVLALHWHTIPQRIPTHFDLSGAPNAWGSKTTLVLMPAIVFVIYLLLTVIWRIPHQYRFPWPITVENRAKQYQIASTLISLLKVEIVWFMGYALWQTIRAGLAPASGFSAAFVPVLILAMLATMGWYLVMASKAQ